MQAIQRGLNFNFFYLFSEIERPSLNWDELITLGNDFQIRDRNDDKVTDKADDRHFHTIP